MKSAKTKQLARALVESGKEHDCFEQLIADLKDVDRKINNNPDLARYLTDKQVEFENKKKALQQIFQDFISAKTFNFIFLLIKSQKLKALNEIIISAEKINKEFSGVTEVVIESAGAINSEQEKQIEKIIKEKLARDVLVKQIINKDLIAGICLRIGDMVIDCSLYGKMMRLKQRIENIE